MTEVYELYTSRKFLYGEGKPRAEREYIVLDADTEGDVVAEIGVNLPQKYDNYPNDAALPFNMLAFDYEITKEPSRVGAWRVVFRYKAENLGGEGYSNPTTTEIEPNEIGYRTARLSMSVEFRDVWRVYSSVSNMRQGLLGLTAGGTSDIAGISIDVAGIPVSTQVQRQELTILITDQYLPSATAIALQIGTRNQFRFLNYEAGTLLFMGCNAVTIPEVGRNSIEYRFVFDQCFHLIQYPVRANTEAPTLATAAVGGVLKGSAYPVYAKQPFPYVSNFLQLSNYFQGL